MIIIISFCCIPFSWKELLDMERKSGERGRAGNQEAEGAGDREMK